MTDRIAVSSALAVDHGWDPLYALGLCSRWSVSVCQIYVTNETAAEKSRLIRIREFAQAKGIELVIHGPADLGSSLITPSLMDAYRYLLEGQNRQVVVTHYNWRIPEQERRSAVEELNRNGLTAGIENFHYGKKSEDLIGEFDSWLTELAELDDSDRSAVAVFDLPRVFHSSVGSLVDSEMLVKRFFSQIPEKGRPFIYHMIDCRSDDQERSSWCALGKGSIPWRDNLIVDDRVLYFILEDEVADHIEPSIRFLSGLIKGRG